LSFVSFLTRDGHGWGRAKLFQVQLDFEAIFTPEDFRSAEDVATMAMEKV